jgi:hypothetical protein
VRIEEEGGCSERESGNEHRGGGTGTGTGMYRYVCTTSSIACGFMRGMELSLHARNDAATCTQHYYYRCRHCEEKFRMIDENSRALGTCRAFATSLF